MIARDKITIVIPFLVILIFHLSIFKVVTVTTRKERWMKKKKGWVTLGYVGCWGGKREEGWEEEGEERGWGCVRKGRLGCPRKKGQEKDGVMASLLFGFFFFLVYGWPLSTDAAPSSTRGEKSLVAISLVHDQTLCQLATKQQGNTGIRGRVMPGYHATVSPSRQN